MEVLLVSAVATPFGGAAAQEKKKALKGLELYSWTDEKGWRYVLVTGTNELKTEQRVETDPNVYTDLDKLAAALKKLPEGETVSWSHMIPGFEYPPKEDVAKVEAAAKDAKVKLQGRPCPTVAFCPTVRSAAQR